MAGSHIQYGASEISEVAAPTVFSATEENGKLANAPFGSWYVKS
jgi:hypothetical protein